MRRILLVALVLTALTPHLWAERFLSVTEAQKVLFPNAERFEARTIRFTPTQIKELEKKLDHRIPNKGQRFWLAYQDQTLLGIVVLDHVFGKHEIIDYALALDPSGAVQQIEILEYRESHGDEIRQAKWRGQFKGKTVSDRLQLHDTIYNLSGATISCRSVTEGVRRVLVTYQELIAPGLRGAGIPAR